MKWGAVLVLVAALCLACSGQESNDAPNPASDSLPGDAASSSELSSSDSGDLTPAWSSQGLEDPLRPAIRLVAPNEAANPIQAEDLVVVVGYSQVAAYELSSGAVAWRTRVAGNSLCELEERNGNGRDGRARWRGWPLRPDSRPRQ